MASSARGGAVQGASEPGDRLRQNAVVGIEGVAVLGDVGHGDGVEASLAAYPEAAGPLHRVRAVSVIVEPSGSVQVTCTVAPGPGEASRPGP